MSTATASRPTAPPASPSESLAALARADAIRFARHPMFLAGLAVLGLFGVVSLVAPRPDALPLEGTVLPAFFIGVFGFVAAHRLTTSLRRTGDLASTAPVGQQRRTIALCVACLVPMTAGLAFMLLQIGYGMVWPPEDAVEAGRTVSWFRDESDVDILAALVANAPLAALGGPLLGVAVARWAPFRGSALLGVVILVFGTAFAWELPDPWNVAAPYINYSDSTVVGGKTTASWLHDGVASHVWACVYTACLCGLAVIAALLRDQAHRRELLIAGGVLTALTAGAFALAVR